MVCFFTSCNNTNNHIHNYGESKTIISSTCDSSGVNRSFCTCGEFIESITPANEHNFYENICLRCGIHFYETDIYRYNYLKPYADKIAIYLVKLYISNNLYESNTVDFVAETIIEQDKYFGYVINAKYKVTCENGVLYNEDKFILRLSHNLDFECNISTIDEGSYLYDLSSLKIDYNWDIKPKNFSYEFYENLLSPQKVTLSDLLNNPKKYENKYVEILDNLYIISKSQDRDSFTAHMDYTGNTNSIELMYGAGFVEGQFIPASRQVAKSVTGYVKIYIDGDAPYIHLFSMETK